MMLSFPTFPFSDVPLVSRLCCTPPEPALAPTLYHQPISISLSPSIPVHGHVPNESISILCTTTTNERTKASGRLFIFLSLSLSLRLFNPLPSLRLAHSYPYFSLDSFFLLLHLLLHTRFHPPSCLLFLPTPYFLLPTYLPAPRLNAPDPDPDPAVHACLLFLFFSSSLALTLALLLGCRM
ncbi:hypothetical protein DFH09DRAFT_366106 [Mycena vulgaris]|nr:hypothetical protein DFH09DRAFT_366106 [Mycena vulgaris]